MIGAFYILAFFATIVMALLSVVLGMVVYVVVSDWIADRRKRVEPLPGPGEPVRGPLYQRSADWQRRDVIRGSVDWKT